MEDGRYGRAEELLLELEEILPDNILPPINLAICYYRLGRPAEAREQIAAARNRDPDNPRMLFALARILEASGEAPEERRQVLAHFATAHPDDPRPHYLEASALSSQKRFSEAAPAWRRAIDRGPENLVLLVESLAAAAQARDPDGVADALDAVEDRVAGFEGSVADYAARLRSLLAEGLAENQMDGIRPLAHTGRNDLSTDDCRVDDEAKNETHAKPDSELPGNRSDDRTVRQPEIGHILDERQYGDGYDDSKQHANAGRDERRA